MSDDSVTGAGSDTVSSTALSSDTRRSARVRELPEIRDNVATQLREQHHPGTGVPMHGIEVSADGVMRDVYLGGADLPDIVGMARELAERIRAAQAAGYRVQMGFAVEALDSIAVSATAQALGEAVEFVPVTTPKQFEPIVQGGPAA